MFRQHLDECPVPATRNPLSALLHQQFSILLDHRLLRAPRHFRQISLLRAPPPDTQNRVPNNIPQHDSAKALIFLHLPRLLNSDPGPNLRVAELPDNQAYSNRNPNPADGLLRVQKVRI